MVPSPIAAGALAALLLFVAGCTQKPQIYHWGVYQDLIYQMYMEPGVADPVGKSALVAIEDMLGRRLSGDAAVYSSLLYLLDGVNREEAEHISSDLLANSAIQTANVHTWEQWRRSPPDR